MVAGGGHAGIEAALAAGRMGARTTLVTLSAARIGEMSCNPAIGGVAKGCLVCEIDALGGIMGEAADASAIQFRMLNRRKGPAVWGPRIQADPDAYRRFVRHALDAAGVRIVEDEVTGLLGPTEEPSGVTLARGGRLEAGSVVLAPGTFMGGVLFRGRERWRGGRAGDMAADLLEADLRARGFHVERFKTGTSPRLVAGSVDLGAMEMQQEDGPGFHFGMRRPLLCGPGYRMPCYCTRSSERTRAAAMRWLGESPLYGGAIQGAGPRYCPSFEDKIVRFPDRAEHQVILEPMGRESRLLYMNGLSTSLPRQAQMEMVRSLPGCASAVVARWGYAVEYGMLGAGEFDATLASTRARGLFLAGQVCGTSGYEEAAALGVLAGRNAAAVAMGREAVCAAPEGGYLGVMARDLARGIASPYRLFSSRAENRLHLRVDNADRRMLPEAGMWGVARPGDGDLLRGILDDAGAALRLLGSARVGGLRALDACRRPDVDLGGMLTRIPGMEAVREGTALSVALDERYRGYADRSTRRVAERERLEALPLDAIGSFMDLNEICWEAREALEKARPGTLGEASRVPGVRPSDLDGLLLAVMGRRST